MRGFALWEEKNNLCYATVMLPGGGSGYYNSRCYKLLHTVSLSALCYSVLGALQSSNRCFCMPDQMSRHT